MKSTKIVFMGSPDFAVPTLTALAENFTVVGVITQPDRPAGRGRKMTSPPVKVLAAELGIPTLQPPRLPKTRMRLRNYGLETRFDSGCRLWANSETGCTRTSTVWLPQCAWIAAAALARCCAIECCHFAWGQRNWNHDHENGLRT